MASGEGSPITGRAEVADDQQTPCMPASSCSDPASDGLGPNQPSVFIQQAFPKDAFVLGPEKRMRRQERGSRAGRQGSQPSGGFHTRRDLQPLPTLCLGLTEERAASGGPAPRAVGAWGLPGSPAAPLTWPCPVFYSHAVCHSQPLRRTQPQHWSDCKTRETPGKNHRAEPSQTQ